MNEKKYDCLYLMVLTVYRQVFLDELIHERSILEYSYNFRRNVDCK